MIRDPQGNEYTIIDGIGVVPLPSDDDINTFQDCVNDSILGGICPNLTMYNFCSTECNQSNYDVWAMYLTCLELVYPNIPVEFNIDPCNQNSSINGTLLPQSLIFGLLIMWIFS